MHTFQVLTRSTTLQRLTLQHLPLQTRTIIPFTTSENISLFTVFQNMPLVSLSLKPRMPLSLAEPSAELRHMHFRTAIVTHCIALR